VAIFSHAQWILLDYLAQADNARLPANLITRLTQEKAKPLSDQETRDAAGVQPLDGPGSTYDNWD
jgi:hypothetical protein